jgi:CheY-like chemotaxis protein/anti-sigma regulatory factor (Ser/Thr protein kinase)
MTTLLLDSPLDDEKRTMLQTVRASGDALVSLLNDILDFSKIEAGRLDLERSDFDIESCVEDVLDVFAGTAAKKGVALASALANDLALRRIGDAARIRQMLVNLVSNAVKFTDTGEVVIHVESVADDGIRFSVRDTGVGVDPKRLTAVFDAFTQADASTTRRFGGTGLGLTIVRRLTERMHGEVFATSVVGVGSTFGFTIPLPRSEERSSESALAFLGGAQVLVVVHHDATREQICRVILQSGGIPIAFANLAEVTFSPELPPSVAILDATARSTPGVEERLGLPIGATIDLVASNDTHASSSPRSVAQPIRSRHLKDALCRATHHEPASRPVPSPFKAIPRTNAFRILVAEDNLVNQRVAQMMLARLGHHVDVVSNGQEAVDSIRTTTPPYDILITDIQMPVMDGLEAARTIRRELPAERQPKIIAMTASAFDDDQRAYIEAGMDDFVSKPVVLATLSAALRRIADAVPRTL